MKTLTAQEVDRIFRDCLFLDGEDTSNAVIVEGVTGRFGFHPGRLDGHLDEVAELLFDLPTVFHEGGGGGCSFLQACMNSDGDQWGEHMHVEQLLVLGLTTKQAKMLLPREMWAVLPGGMPYFSVNPQISD